MVPLERVLLVRLRSALKNQQVFLWLTNGMKLSNVSPWLLPSVTKVLVGEELWPFLGNFK